MARVRYTCSVILIYLFNGILAAVTSVTLCPTPKNISSGGYVTSAVINKKPRQSYAGRSIGECLQWCAQDIHCFSSTFNPKNNTCDFYTETIPLLPYVRYTDVGMNGKFIASSFDNPISTATVFNCTNFCQMGERCRMDCGYGTGALAQPICIADHTNCLGKPNSNFMFARFSPIQVAGTSVVAKTVTYTKLSATSTLRLSWRGDLRSPGGCTDCCTRYALQLNGTECSNPGPLEFLNYQTNYAVYEYRSSGIEGLCYGLPYGLITITMVITPCPSGPGSVGQGYVGYQAASWIYAQELELPIDPVACPGFVSLNVQQFQTSAYVENNVPHQYTSMFFTKIQSSTVLKITFNGGYRIWPVTSRCATWYYTFNGTQCLKPGRAEMAISHHGNIEPGGMRLRYGIFEVYCYNLPTGVVNITLNVDTCPAWNSIERMSTGWPAGTHYTRFIVEEVQMGTDMSAALTVADGKSTIDRLPSYNLFAAWQLNSEWGGTGAAANIRTLIHPKRSSRTALRVTLNTGGRAQYVSYSCCRFYITFNGTECAAPGNIDAIIDESLQNINYLRQFLVDGICTGLPAGNVTLALNAMKCPQLAGQADCYIGWQTTSYFYASEILV